MKEQYINFDEYIRQGEPEQQEKAGYWQTVICYHPTNIKKYINDLVDVKLLRVVNGDSRNSKDIMYVKC